MEFKDKVLRVRVKLNISQEVLAKELGVSFSTVNRWEQGHTIPTKKTQMVFDEFCKTKHLNFEEII